MLSSRKISDGYRDVVVAVFVFCDYIHERSCQRSTDALRFVKAAGQRWHQSGRRLVWMVGRATSRRAKLDQLASLPVSKIPRLVADDEAVSGSMLTASSSSSRRTESRHR